MTFEHILDSLSFNAMSVDEAYREMNNPKNKRVINYYIHKDDIDKEPLKDYQLSQLEAIVGILQILYNSKVGSPVSDEDYDTLQETLVHMGIPRLTGTIEINDSSKLSHSYKNLRGTLDKVYYLTLDEKRMNRSRRYLDEWIKSAESKYEKLTGKKIDLNEELVCVQCKFDGVSCVAEIDDDKITWLTRGDTRNNRASDVSHIMRVFNDAYSSYSDCGIKFEVMVSEEGKDKINEFFASTPYKNSRQIATATLNSNEIDLKSRYLQPIPLRIIKRGESIERIHPELMDKFATVVCKLGDRDAIRKFANENRLAKRGDHTFRTDGAVLTFVNEDIQKVLGRDNDINQFEVAYKFTEEVATSSIVSVEFETSMFGYIAPVAKFNTVILKGNAVNRASLSNKERFDELDLHYGDPVMISYDIIPYLTKVPGTKPRGKKIPFTHKCPTCGSELNLNVTQVRCENPNCESRIVGRILNYCNNLRIQNIGYNTLVDLYRVGLLKKGIRSLYKLKKKMLDMETIDGFGRLKCKKIVAEIESKRALRDYEFFGALGIDNLSTKTFETIFRHLPYIRFIEIIKDRKIDDLILPLKRVPGIGDSKTAAIIEHFKDAANRVELLKIIDELVIEETYNTSPRLGKIVFSGIRPEELMEKLVKKGWEISNSISKDTKYLIVKDIRGSSSKMEKAKSLGVDILQVDQVNIDEL